MNGPSPAGRAPLSAPTARAALVGATLLAALTGLGCEADRQPSRVAITSSRSATRATPSATSAPARPDDTSKAVVVVDPRIQEACNMPTPHFAFDSASVEGDPALDVLASCFLRGPMTGKELRLVGHADPRGDFEYNVLLGHERAGNVANYLESKGLTDDRIATSSRGEMDATGQDESGWAEDRRVDILLAD
ncbi:MAG: OmpA family protein [Polyangiaceae bacterium]